MSVVRGQTRRRWTLVLAGAALLCLLPVIDSALPVSVPAISAPALRAAMLASADLPYSGYAESDATFGLPALTGFSDVTALLDGVTRMRVWQASPAAWRVDVLSDTGERDTYQTPHASYTWDSYAQLLTEVVGSYPVRLPRAADLVPASLALRLLREAGPGARLSKLAPRRVAGIAAAGLRVVPDDPGTTIGHIDIWAEPGSWLPLQVAVYGRGNAQPALETEFLQVSHGRPARSVLTPQRGPGTGFAETDAADLAGALNDLGPVFLPGSLAGLPRVTAPAGFGQVGIYGRGLGIFAALEINGTTGLRLIGDARLNGGTELKIPGVTGVIISTRVINAALMHPDGSGGTFVLAGLVQRDVLLRAAADLARLPWYQR